MAPVALIAIAPALVSMALMPLAAGLRILYERHRGGHARRRAT